MKHRIYTKVYAGKEKFVNVLRHEFSAHTVTAYGRNCKLVVLLVSLQVVAVGDV